MIIVDDLAAEGPGLVVVPLPPAGADEALVDEHRVGPLSIVHAEIELHARQGQIAGRTRFLLYGSAEVGERILVEVAAEQAECQ